jgi:hypothetical protein
VAVALAALGLAIGVSNAAYADGDPYPALPIRNSETGLCVDSSFYYGETNATPAYVTECNSSHVNQGWNSSPTGTGVDVVQIGSTWSGCLQAVPSTRSVVVAPCDSNNIDQAWVVYAENGPGSSVGIWSNDSAACGYICYLGDDQGLGLDANSGFHSRSFELWTAPQAGGN